MKDIQTLYLAARRGKSEQDLSSYSEAVKELLESHPNRFVSNLEYIISSDMNLPVLDDFVERYGLAVPACNKVISLLEQFVEEGELTGKDTSAFKNSLEKYESYRDSHINCFSMYEYYSESSKEFDEKYMESYYGFNQAGIQGRKLPVGMIQKYGNCAIPDAIMSSSYFGEKAMKTVYEYLDQSISDAICRQWIVESSSTINTSNIPAYIHIEETNLAKHVKAKLTESNQVLREAVLTGNEDAAVEYTEEDVDAIRDLISIREYQAACESSDDKAYALQEEVYSLYETLNSIEDEDGYTGIDILESKSPEKEAAKAATKKIISLAKELTKSFKPAAKAEYKSLKKEIRTDKRQGLYGLRGGYLGSIRVAIGDEDDAFIFTKSGTMKAVKNDSGKGEYIDGLRLYIQLEHVSYTSHNAAQCKALQQVLMSAIQKCAIWDHVKSSDIKLSNIATIGTVNANSSQLGKEQNLDEYTYVYTTYYYTCSVSAQISRKYVFGGIVTESLDMTAVMENVINDLQRLYDNTPISEARLDSPDSRYTGGAPRYLAKNHDLSWGEEDDGVTATSIEDYRRPSAGDAPASDPEPEQDKKDDHLYGEPDEDPTEGEESDDTSKGHGSINNYYYYTYTNSLNKNDHSFNKDNSSHDDHSYNKGDNRSTNTSVPNEHHESAKPWELNVSAVTPITEKAGDADKMKPESDHPIKDALTDIDRKLGKVQQGAKKAMQNVGNAGKVFMKPIKRTSDWVGKMIIDWKDAKDTKLREKIADPRQRKGLFSAVTWCIKTGSLLKAGLLLNPIFLFLSITKKAGAKKKEARLRREVMAELNNELKILDEKIKDANGVDNRAKYKMMRLQNELNKKFLRVAGSDVRDWRKVI